MFCLFSNRCCQKSVSFQAVISNSITLKSLSHYTDAKTQIICDFIVIMFDGSFNVCIIKMVKINN